MLLPPNQHSHYVVALGGQFFSVYTSPHAITLGYQGHTSELHPGYIGNTFSSLHEYATPAVIEHHETNLHIPNHNK
jgi:hypothetical protein